MISVFLCHYIFFENIIIKAGDHSVLWMYDNLFDQFPIGLSG